MSSNNNNKQPLDLTESLPVFDKAQAPSTTRVQSAEGSTTTPTVNKPGEKNDTLDIPEINQPDVTTRNLSHSDELTIGFLLDCAERGQNRSNQRPPSICKVSRMLRDHSESSYEPQLVSIGPIHREDPKLQEFEWQKECYLNDLLNRCHDSTPKKTLEECLLKVNTLIPQIRESYAGMIENYSDDKLARMMVMDGCFILEFCFKHEDEDLYLPNKMQNSRIAMDLMLLENQVPFVVLQGLFHCLEPYMFRVFVTLNQVLDTYFAPYFRLFRGLPEKNSTTYVDSDLSEKNSTTYVDSDLSEKNSTTYVVDSDSTYGHVLGYLHKRYQLVLPAKASKHHQEDEERIENTAFHSIVELDRSGINFKRHQEDEWSMTIKFQSSPSCLAWFWSEATLLMPTLVIEDFTEVILRNFIAYEQSFPQDRYYFTSYAHAMDKLIDTQEDIAKLVESKVLVNNLGSNQEAADMINKLCKNISITDFYYTKQFTEIDKYQYHSRFWRKYIVFSLTVFKTVSTITGTS